MASCIKNIHDAARADGPPAPAVTVSLHALRGDATNAQVWQKSKLHTLELTAGYVSTPIHEHDTLSSVLKNFKVRREMGDLQVVGRSTTQGTHGMILKQLTSTYSKSW
eukprot:3995779-Pyramimonas_sp.AAC.1